MKSTPIVPYIHRAPLRLNFFTRYRVFSVVKNHSQFNSDASSAISPASRNMACMMWCTIMAYCSCAVQPCAFSCISTPSRVMSASPIVSLTM